MTAKAQHPTVAWDAYESVVREYRTRIEAANDELHIAHNKLARARELITFLWDDMTLIDDQNPDEPDFRVTREGGEQFHKLLKAAALAFSLTWE